MKIKLTAVAVACGAWLARGQSLTNYGEFAITITNFLEAAEAPVCTNIVVTPSGTNVHVTFQHDANFGWGAFQEVTLIVPSNVWSANVQSDTSK